MYLGILLETWEESSVGEDLVGLFQLLLPQCVCPEVGLLGRMAVLFPV